MQKTILFVALLLVQLIYAQQEKYDVVFKNVKLVSLDKNTITELQSVAVTRGKILVIENTKKSKLKGVKEFDLKGHYIMPSLADAHVHLPEEETDLKRFFELNLILKWTVIEKQSNVYFREIGSSFWKLFLFLNIYFLYSHL